MNKFQESGIEYGEQQAVVKVYPNIEPSHTSVAAAVPNGLELVDASDRARRLVCARVPVLVASTTGRRTVKYWVASGSEVQAIVDGAQSQIVAGRVGASVETNYAFM